MCGWLAVITLLAIVAATRAGAQGPDTVIRTDPSTIQISPGEVVTLSVVLAGAQEVYGIDVRAAFDPQLVEVVDVDPDREGVQFSPGTFPQPDFVVRRDADNEAGTLRYVITQVSPTEPATGDGVVFTVQLRALADSGEGAFTLGPIEMADSAGTLLGSTAGERPDQDHAWRAGPDRSAGGCGFCCRRCDRHGRRGRCRRYTACPSVVATGNRRSQRRCQPGGYTQCDCA
jgi:hypothetical protein